MVACDGVYADISDENFQLKTIEGDVHLTWSTCFKIAPSGLRDAIGAQRVRQLFPGSANGKEDGLTSWRAKYKSYKESYAKHLLFDPEEPNLSEQRMLWFTKAKHHLCISGVTLEHAPLEEVYIFFDTATYDQIERDVKVNFS